VYLVLNNLQISIFSVIDDVCGDRTFKSAVDSAPFELVWRDEDKTHGGGGVEGGARIVLAKGRKLDYEITAKYDLGITKDGCLTGEYSSNRCHMLVFKAFKF